MRFMLDENVPAAVADMLRSHGHEVDSIRVFLAPGANDPLVATITEEEGAILISFDGDFEHIAPRIPKGQRRRFRKLSRIWMRCSEPQAAQRLERALAFVEAEFAHCQGQSAQMRLTIAAGFMRTDR